jgi:hypothetical protein
MTDDELTPLVPEILRDRGEDDGDICVVGVRETTETTETTNRRSHSAWTPTASWSTRDRRRTTAASANARSSAVEHDPTTGLMAIHTGTRLLLLDHNDLAIAAAALIRLASNGHIFTPDRATLDPKPR